MTYRPYAKSWAFTNSHWSHTRPERFTHWQQLFGCLRISTGRYISSHHGSHHPNYLHNACLFQNPPRSASCLARKDSCESSHRRSSDSRTRATSTRPWKSPSLREETTADPSPACPPAYQPLHPDQEHQWTWTTTTNTAPQSTQLPPPGPRTSSA